jgi:hypothetical protein
VPFGGAPDGDPLIARTNGQRTMNKVAEQKAIAGPPAIDVEALPSGAGCAECLADDGYHHPLDQPVPGPTGRVPRDWQRHLH